ncbi:MAG TPA: serine/threonine-protein kinase [Planctomycetota bacterium]
MSGDLASVHYRLLSEHFQACVDLSERERDAYLLGPRLDDPALREDLRALLAYHARAPEVAVDLPAVRRSGIRDVLPFLGLGALAPLALLAPAGPARWAVAGLVSFLAGALFAGRHRGPAFGFYELKGPIGQGGVGDVYLARHSVLHRRAALKVLRASRPDAAAVARFKREARLAGRLGHPNAVQIFDYGETPDGRLYYAMEYVDGLNLAQLLSVEGPLPLARSLYLLRQISGALEEAHGLGLLHRDLKPSNIMVARRGGLGDVVKILDFGLASSGSGRSTRLEGTPAYIAPERIRQPRRPDVRSDIYSFGGVAFHMLTGRSVFEGPGPAELLYQVFLSARPSPSKLRGEPLPAALERLVLDCLAVDPASRPSSMREITGHLRSIATPDRWSQDEARAWWSANGDRIARLKGVN